MTPARRNLKLVGIISGLLILFLIAVVNVKRPRRISVIYMGMRATPGGARPLFVITNPLPYRITWTASGPEFKSASEWTTSHLPNVRFGGETLEAGTACEIYGIPHTNVACRYSVLWGLHPQDALARPKWRRVVDDWSERIGLGPWFLPNGVERSPMIPAELPDKGGPANGSHPTR